MEIASFCQILLSATLTIQPDRSQFFWYERVDLSCAVVAGNSSGWIFSRNTSYHTADPSSSGWGMTRGSTCTIDNIYPLDSGVYWCQSERGECSNAINITVTDVEKDAVILQSPSLPVTEGDDVTLQCLFRKEHGRNLTSDFSASYYKDGVFIGTHWGGMTLQRVTRSDEGSYRCEHPVKGASPESSLAVRARALSPPPFMSVPRLLCTVLLILLYAVILTALCVNVHSKWAKARASVER